jgi:Phosphodiester glycosidase
MSRRVPGGGDVRPEWPDGPEWPDEHGHGQGYDGDQGPQRRGYDRGEGGPGPGQYGQYRGPANGYGPADGSPQGNGYGPGNGSGPGNGYAQADEYGQGGGYGQTRSYDAQGRGGYGPDGYGQQGYGQERGQQDYPQQDHGRPGYRQPGYDQRGYAPDGYGQQQYPQPGYGAGGQGYQGAGQGYPDDAGPRGQFGGPPQGNMHNYEDQGNQAPGRGPGDPALDQAPHDDGPGDRPRPRKVRFRRTRRLFRLRTVRVISVLLALCLVWLTFSVGQAALKNNGQGLAANLAEWARDHKLGAVVTFGEWATYKPPPKGGKPPFSLAVPSGEAVASGKPGKGKAKGFTPDIPATLKSLAGSPIAGEGQWRVAETVKGQPAILSTFLRDATYTSQVNGIASIDQRLVKFSLRPGSEDPGPGNWGVSDYIPAGSRKGLLATFNGGFKLDSAGGGFYLNGIHHGSLVKGTASIVYYKDGTIKIGEWGRDLKMGSTIEGVRQNLQLLVDHGKVAGDANSNVMSNWGATLGGGYYVWRSGLGITKDGRIVYVYGPSLNAKDLGQLLQRAGAVEGMQMDINPSWMKFDYYQAKGNPADPKPMPLLPTQQPDPYSYYTPSTRDFTAVYAR